MQTMTPTVKDIPYAAVGGKPLLLDLYLPRGVTRPCLVVWLHGGAWQFGTKDDVRTDLVEAGYALASVDFRQASEAAFPAQIHDIKAAVRFLRARAVDYGYRSDRIALWGASSGGHLAALAGVTRGNGALEGNIGDHPDQDAGVQAVIDFYGPTNLTTILEQSTPHGLSVRIPALTLLLGGPMSDAAVRDLARLASPVLHVDKNAPPLLMIHGVQDNQVPVNQSLELQGAYAARGLDVQLELIQGAGHMDEIYYERKNIEIVAAFLERVLKN